MANKIIYNVGFNTDISGLQKLKQELSSLSQYTMKDLLKVNTTATEQDLKNLQSSINIIQTALDRSYNFKLDSTNIVTFQQELSKSGVSLNTLAANLSKAGVQGQIAFKSLATDLLTTNTQLKQSHSLLDSMAKTLGNTLKWSIASSAINGVTRSVQQAWGFTKSLDESLTNIRIVTERSADDMDKFAKKANNAAKALGAATTEYTNAALIYYQQGLGDEDVAARTEATVKAANVTGQSAAEVSEQLTAVWNGYKVVAEEAETYVDKLAAVAATTAADLEELSTGMSKVASAAAAMGVDVDQLSAQLATIVSVTRQDASVVGTALKTIFSRMGDLKVDGVDEFGVALGDVSSQMETMGIHVLDQQGNLRDMGIIIEEVAAKWETWTRAQQQAAAVAMAGKRQYNNLIALFENWDMYESALSTSQNSEGTLQKQQDIYLDSLEGKLKQLKVAGEEVYAALFDSDSMKDLISGLTFVVERFADFTDAIGGGGQLLFNFGSIALTVFQKQISGGIVTAWNNLTSFYQNTQSIAAELLTTSQLALSASEKEIPGLQAIVRMKEEELRYARYMSAEDKQRFETNIQMVGAAQDRLALLQEEAKALEAQRTTAEALLSSQKIYAQNPSSEKVVTGSFLRAGEALTANEIASRQLDTPNYSRGSITSYQKFNIDTEEGRGAAIEAIDQRISMGDTQLEYATGMRETLSDIGINQKGVVSEASGYLDNVDLFTQGYKGAPEDIQKVTAAQTELKNALDEYKQAVESGQGVEDAYNKVRKTSRRLAEEHTKAIEKDNAALREARGVIKDYPKLTEKNTQAQKKANAELEKATLNYKKFAKETKSKAIINNITGITTGLTRMTSAISTLTNLADIFNNEDMSGGEKALAIIQNMGMALPMLVSGLGSVVTGFKSFAAAQTTATALSKAFSAEQMQSILLSKNVNEETLRSSLLAVDQSLAERAKAEGLEATVRSLNKQQAAQVLANAMSQQAVATNTTQTATEVAKGKAGTVAGNELFKAGIKAQLGFWPLLVIGLAIAAVLATIIALIVVFNKDTQTATEVAKKGLEEAQEAAKRYQEELKNAKDAYKNLISEIENYREAQDALSKLTEGTEEWKEAVFNLNQQVLDLMTNYPELTKYIKYNEQGVLEISQEGFDAVIESQRKNIRTATLNNISGQANLYAQKTNYKQAQAEDAIRDKLADGATDQNWLDYALGGIISGAVAPVAGSALGPTGLALGATLGLGLGVGAVAYQDQKYENADAAAKRLTSDSFIKDLSNEIKDIENLSDDQLKVALQKILPEGLALEDNKIIDALMDNKDALMDGVQAIQQQTLATQALNQTYAQTLAEEKGFTGDAASVYTDIVSATTLTTQDLAQRTESAINSFKFDTTVQGEWVGKKINTRDDREAAAKEVNSWIEEAYGSGGNLTQKDFKKDVKNLDEFKNKEFTLTLDDGTTVKKTGLQIIQDAAAARVKNEVGEASQAVESEIKNLQAAGLSENYAYFTSGPAVKAEMWKNVTGADLQQLANQADEAEQKGVLTAEERSSIEKALNNRKNILTSVYQGAGFDYLNLSNFTDDDLQTFKNNLAAAESVGASRALSGIFEDFAEDPVALEKINELASAIDWTNPDSINNFVSQMNDLGYEIDTNEDSWKDFISTVNSGMKLWINNSETVKTNLATIKDIASEIEPGEIISDEDYKKLLALNPEMKKFFIQTANGWKSLTSGQTLETLLKQNYQDLVAIKEYYDEVNQEGKNLSDKAIVGLDLNKSTDAINFFNSLGTEQGGAADKLYNFVVGGNAELVRKNLAIVTNPNADTSSAEYQQALQYLQSIGGKVNDTLLQIKNGQFNSQEGQEIWATEVANSWSEVNKAYEAGKIDQEVFDKVEKSWKNTYLMELGLALSDSVIDSLDVTELEKTVQEARQLELDYFVEIEAALNKIDRAADKAFGKDKLKLLKEQEVEQNRAIATAGLQFNTAKSLFTGNIANAGLGEYLNADGSLNVAGLNNLLITLDPEKDKDQIQNINQILTNYSQVIDTESNLLDQQDALLDLQIEQYQYQIEVIQDFQEEIKNWRKTLVDFKKYTKEGITAFEKLSANETLSNAYDIATLSGAFSGQLPSSYQNVLNHEIWKNGGGANNPYLGSDGTFKESSYWEGREAALETFQSDIEAMDEAVIDLYDAWFAGLEALSTLYDEQVEKVSTINSLLEAGVDLSKILLTKTDGYANTIVGYYTTLKTNAETAVTYYAAQADSLLSQYNEFFDENGNLKEGVNKDMADEVWKSYAAAKQNYLDAMQAQADAIQAEFENGMQAIVDEAFGKATNGLGLESFSELWDMQKAQDELYFDAVNAEYQIYKFSKEMQKSIDGTTNIAAQNKLKSILEEQLEILEKKDKLSQYDIDRANAMYELTLKQIALEEAQQTASKMKLTRDAFGNYSYQYVSDQDKIAEAEMALAEAQNKFYNLEKNRQKELIDNAQAYWSEYISLTSQYWNDPAMLGKIEEAYMGEEGFITMSSKAMEELGLNLADIEAILGKNISTPWMDTFANIGNLDMNQILTNTAGLMENTTNSLASLQQLFSTYQSQEGQIIDRFSSYVSSLEEVNREAGALSINMNAAKDALNLAGVNLSVLSTVLETAVQTYIGDLSNKIPDYTTALNNNTAQLESINANLSTLTENGISISMNSENNSADTDIIGYLAIASEK